jgi:hypothetical protein
MVKISADIRKEVVDAATKDAEACWSALAGKLSAEK